MSRIFGDHRSHRASKEGRFGGRDGQHEPADMPVCGIEGCSDPVYGPGAGGEGGVCESHYDGDE